jgi:hypothetical protein
MGAVMRVTSNRLQSDNAYAYRRYLTRGGPIEALTFGIGMTQTTNLPPRD